MKPIKRERDKVVTPWQQALLDYIIEHTYSGKFSAPTQNEIAEDFGKSRSTVRNALRTLERKGKLKKLAGHGNYEVMK